MVSYFLAYPLATTKKPPQIPLNRTSRQKIAPPPPPPVVFTTKSTNTGTWRIGTVKFRRIQLAVVIDRQLIRDQMATINQIFLVSLAGLLISIAVGAWLVSKSAMRLINDLTMTIQQVSVKGLDRRIPLNEINTEFVELIQVFNQMMERLERSFYQSSRFSGDAAHELKTPLTILQGELERTLQQVPAGSEIQQRLGNLLNEVSHLSGIVRKLLLFSLADAGQMSLYLVEVNISELLCQMLEDVEMQAPHLTLRTNIPQELKVKGDLDLLMQVLQNLFSNAVKYNLAHGWIAISAQQTEQKLQIIITNASKEISVSDRG